MSPSPPPPARTGKAAGQGSGGGRTGRPPRTSRAEILDAARRLIDRDGWEKLTIRRLAAEADVGATTLYHHIRDKEDLLLQLLNHHAKQLEQPPLPAEPRERVLVAATAMHDALAGWPWAAEVLTTDGFVGLLDESALWMVEAIVGGARDLGRSPEEAVDLFRVVWYFTVGEILVRARTADRKAAGGLPPSRAVFDAGVVPHLAAIGPRWRDLSVRDTYPQGLRALVDAYLG